MDIMTDHKCPRCQARFFSAITNADINCPFCGYFLKPPDEKRSATRAFITKDCMILKGENIVKGHTIDLSDKGVSVHIGSFMPLKQNELLDIVIRDLEIKASAEVIWTKNFDNSIKAGLRFH